MICVWLFSLKHSPKWSTRNLSYAESELRWIRVNDETRDRWGESRGRQTCTEGSAQETLWGHERAWKSYTRHRKTQNHGNISHKPGCLTFPLSLLEDLKHVGSFSIDPLPSHTTFSVLLDTKLINKQWFTDVLWNRCSHLIFLPCHPHLALLPHLLAPNFHRHPLYSTHPLAFISQAFSPPFPSSSSSLPLPLPPPLPLSLHQKAEDINTFQPGEG